MYLQPFDYSPLLQNGQHKGRSKGNHGHPAKKTHYHTKTQNKSPQIIYCHSGLSQGLSKSASLVRSRS